MRPFIGAAVVEARSPLVRGAEPKPLTAFWISDTGLRSLRAGGTRRPRHREAALGLGAGVGKFVEIAR